MIASLKGRLLSADLDEIIVDVLGVGYEVACSSPTLSDLQTSIGEEVHLWIYTHVREDAFQLFGFLQKAEKQLFTSLLKVNGVGPKSALSILSGARAEQILEFIEAGDAKALSSLPKVGKKTAEQIVLTLQGKLVKVESVGKGKVLKPTVHKDISSALVNLGFKPQLVEQFVGDLPKETTLEEGVRKGLQTLTGQI